MANIDTLKYFNELKASGIPEEAALAQVYALSASLTDLVTKDDLNSGLRTVELDLKVYFAYLVGGFAVLNLVVPVILKYLGR